MISSRRLLLRTLFTNSKKNVLGAYSVQSSATIREHARCFSLENQKTNLEDKALSAQISVEVKRVDKVYKKQRNNYFNKYVDSCFLKHEFSPSYVVSFMRTACVDHSCSQELISSLMVALNKCLKSNFIELDLSLDQKIEILNSVLRPKYFQVLPLICSSFKIDETAQSLKGFVDDLILNQKITEAAYCIGALSLQQEYDLIEILLPLLIEGKMNPVITCISNCPEVQVKIAQKLDSFLDPENLKTTSNFAIAFNSKHVFKTLSTLVNVFKIPPEQCKNLHFIRGRAAINILLKKKYEQSILENTWEDMVMSVIAQNPLLKEHLMYKLVLNKDMDTALKMISKLDMQDFDVTSLKLKVENASNSETLTSKMDDEEISAEKCDTGAPGHLSFPLSTSDIHFIDTKEKFFNCIKDIIENYKIIGVDSEWKPHFGLSHDRLSLIQLAVHDKVYIMDMISLNECLEAKLWDRLIGDIFASSKIVKLGCGIMTDIQMIVDANKGSHGRVMRFSHILDLAVFYQKLLEVYPDNFEDLPDGTKRTLGLSKLCEIVLGKSLNKEERLCDWEKRPLTEPQLRYAALDAHCLLQIYDELKKVAREKDMNFDHMANVALVLTSSLSKPKKRLRQIRNEKGFQIHNPIPIQKFKVVVDSELKFLGKQLKQLGADVVILSDTDTHEAAIQISNSEDRRLICSESLWNLVQDKVSQAFCTTSMVDLESDEVSVSHIIQNFNVQLKAKCMLPRCLTCDSEEGMWLSPENVNVLQEWTSENTPMENDTDMSSFQKTLSELTKSGIDIKFNQQTNDKSSHSIQPYLCTKCGTVQ